MSKGKYYFSKSLEKGLKILALFNGDTPVLTQSEIARRLGLNMTSTFRYINTLVELGYLEKNPKTREIRPSILYLQLCLRLSKAANHLEMIKEVVDRIHSKHNISIDVALAVDDSMVRLYHRSAEETFTYRLPDSAKNCLHNTALGKAYLSSLPDRVVMEKTSVMALEAKTAKTIVDKHILAADIAKAKARQYAIADEEYLTGLVSIGAPLVDPGNGKGIGAVSFDFSVLQHDAAVVETKYADLIKEAAKLLSELLPPKIQSAGL